MDTERIWVQFAEPIHRYVHSKVKDDANAADLVQDAFVKIHLNHKNLKNRDKLESWVFQIVRNTVMDFFRKNSRAPNNVTINDQLDSLDNDQEEERFKNCLIPFLDDLPPKYRQAIELSELQGKKHKDIAKELGLSVSAIKSRVQRGREMIRNRFLACCAQQHSSDASRLVMKEEACEICGCQ